MRALKVIQNLEATIESRSIAFGENDSSVVTVREMLTTVREMYELLHAAKGIADRQGAETAWERFSDSIAKLGINGMTARTYRVLPNDENQSPKK